MRVLELVNAIAENIPVQHFLVNIRKQNPTGETSKVSIALYECLGIQNNGLLEITALISDRSSGVTPSQLPRVSYRA